MSYQTGFHIRGKAKEFAQRLKTTGSYLGKSKRTATKNLSTRTTTDMQPIKTYQVVISSLIGWPTGEVILHIAYNEPDAQTYIDSYPNLFMRPYLKIKPVTMRVEDTD